MRDPRFEGRMIGVKKKGSNGPMKKLSDEIPLTFKDEIMIRFT